MRSLWTIGGTGLAALVLAGCDKGGGAEQDASHAARSLAAAADHLADSLDRADNGSNQIDAVAAHAERLADRAAAVAVPAGSSLVTDNWIGRWTGIEGLNLVIARDRGKGRGHYTLTMQYTLDDKGVFEGVADGEAIRFARPDGTHELYAARGDETGLKWLADRKDCLMVAKGEGYCRG